MFAESKFRLRQSIGIVSNDGLIDFFKANVRDIIKIKISFSDIVSLLKLFDGVKTVKEVAQAYGKVEIAQLIDLVLFLNQEYILIEQNEEYPWELIKNEYRLINFLEDYCHSTREVREALDKLANAKVMIVGLGAVGSFIATYLAKSRVRNFILVDSDVVDISNIHRQYYFEDQIGESKLDAISKELRFINPKVVVEKINDNLDENFFENLKISSDMQLIINCADEPSVDVTSRIIAKYAMKHRIPHIVGGGYNLHLTLVGQSIIPYKTACFECFQIFLEKLNNPILLNVRKLYRENRKVGSFPPLSGIASSLAALDAFKILIGRYDILQQANKRIEFNLKAHQFNSMLVERDPNCSWCGKGV